MALDVSTLQNQLRTYEQALRQYPFTTLSAYADYYLILNGISGTEFVMTTPDFSDMLKPATVTFVPTDAPVSDRVLSIKLADIDFKGQAINTLQSNIGFINRQNLSPLVYPESQIIWMQIINDGMNDFVLQSLWSGILNPVGTTPLDVMDGYLKIIIDELGLGTISVPIGNQFATGDLIGQTDVVEKLMDMYDALPAPMRTKDINVYMSNAVRRAYNDSFLLQFPGVQYNDKFSQVFLPNSDNKATIKMVPGLGGSERVVMTEATNMVIAFGSKNENGDFLVAQINPKEIGMTYVMQVGAQFGSINPRQFICNDRP